MAKREAVVTPVFRAAFVNVFKPSPGINGGKPKYRLVMLFDKEAQKTKEFAEMKRIAQAEALAKWGDKSKLPKDLDGPFKDGNTKPEYDGYPGTIFASASRDAEKMGKPGVVDSNRAVIMDEMEVYSGCYMRAKVVAYAYAYLGKNGVRFGLQHLQKVKDGEPFAGGGRAEEAFDSSFDAGNGEGEIEAADATKEDIFS